jgi:hypothetical protein
VHVGADTLVLPQLCQSRGRNPVEMRGPPPKCPARRTASAAARIDAGLEKIWLEGGWTVALRQTIAA